MRVKNLSIILAIPLLAVSCGLPFSNNSGKVGGVYKTTNSGRDWTINNQVVTETVSRRGKVTTETSNQLASADVRQLVFAPNNQTKRMLAAGGRRGLYITEDEGETWKNILTGLNVYSVGTDPSDKDRIYAGGTLNSTGQILLTEDGGKTWQTVYSDTGSRSNVQSLAVREDGQFLAASTSIGSVLVSGDRGRSWTFVYQMNGSVSQVMWQGNELYVLHSRNGLLVSSDFKQELRELTTPLTNTQSQLYSAFTSKFPAVQRPNDFFQMAIRPGNPNNIYLATDTGLFETKDKGVNWQPVTLPIQITSGVGRTYAVSVTDNPDRVMAAVAGNIHTSLNGGQSWEVKTVAVGGTIRYILPDPEQSNIIYIGAERLR